MEKIAQARRAKNNFSNWHKANPINYDPLRHSADLAELYGTMLGDGCLEKFPRTEKLDISFNVKESDHIEHIRKLLINIFKKEPSQRRILNCVHLTIYQKNISSRLQFPCGEKRKYDIRILDWIMENKKYLIPCLKGLFETDGSWVIDSKYNTNCMDYTSVHENLLKDIQGAMRSLGFYANLTKKRVILSRRAETAAFAKLIKFRQY